MAGAIWYVDSNKTGGANNGLTKANAFLTLGQGFVAASTGDYIRASHLHNEAVVNGSYICEGQIVTSIDFSDDTYLRGASISSLPSNSDISFPLSVFGGLALYGFDFSVGDDFRPASVGLGFYDCTLVLGGFGDKLDLVLNSVSVFENFDYSPAHILGTIEYSGGSMHIKGGSLTTPVTNFLSQMGGGGAGDIIIEAYDLSLADNLVLINGQNRPNKAIFIGCLLKAGFTISTGQPIGYGSMIALYGSHSSNIPYFIQEQHKHGGIIIETTNVKAGGSSDGTTPISMKFVTGATAVRYSDPLRMALPIKFYASITGVQTFDVDIMTDGETLDNDEAWIEASVPGTTIQRDISNSLPANPLTTPTALPLSAATWDESGIGVAVKQTISLTVDVKQVGWVEAHICFARPSATMYADLKLLDGQRQYLAGQAYINGEAVSTPTQAPEDKVIDGIVYDDGNKTGNYVQLPEDEGKFGSQWGANGTEFTGTLETTIKGPVKLIKLDTGIKVIKL